MLISLVFQAQILQLERQALIDLYNATDGDNQTNNTNCNTTSNPTNDKYVIGTSVTLTAIADAGFQFDVSNLSKGIYLIKIIT